MFNRPNISDWLNRTNYTAEERRNICAQIMSEAQYWDSTQYLRMMHDSTKRPWVGLTDEDIDVIYLQHHNQYGECESPNWGYERAIEAKLKERNAQE